MRTKQAITAADFELGYAERSGITVEELRSYEQVVVRCDCDSPDCRGWASVSRSIAELDDLEVVLP